MSEILYDRWEHGSEFHWIPAQEVLSDFPGYVHNASLWGSGRDALLALIEQKKWHRIWCPSYYCDGVILALQQSGIELCFYPDSPLEKSPNLENIRFKENDLCLVVNYFGLRNLNSLSDLIPEEVTLLEDHTQDLSSDWAKQSRAHYCFASLRKTLPLPDGGILWSPRGLKIPAEIKATDEHRLACDQKLKSMILKTQYLAGEPILKESYRQLAVFGEAGLGLGPISGISEYSRKALACLPVNQWRLERLRNFASAQAILVEHTQVKLLVPESNCVPFSVNLLFQNASVRERIKSRLIESKIYPAVLWLNARDNLSDRLISVHCDHRYSSSDMTYVAEKIVALL